MTAIDEKYRSLGGKESFLKAPTTPERVAPDGVGHFRHYKGGSIYWHPDTGAFEVHGKIRDKWESLKWEQGFLGYPVTDETATPDGVGRFNHFQGGSIYFHPDIGTYEVHGMIRDKWAALGWEQSYLGYPKSDENGTPDKVGRFSRFQGGSIYFHPDTGANEVHGMIQDKWASLKWERGFLGYPITDETVTPDGAGRYNHFQGGSIYWHPDTGANEVHGMIRDKWAALGGEQSYLGYPKSDENGTPDKVGRFSRFQGGSIYWHPDTGANEVHGMIQDEWASLGWERGFLGYPITDETATPDGAGRFNRFQGGWIYWHPDTGANEVHGMIRDKWESLGSERGPLGYPTSDETRASDKAGRYNHFQGGSIYYHPDIGTYEVQGKIRDKWESLGWEQGLLGYPISDENVPPDGIGRFSHFQHGSIYWHPNIGAYEVHGAIRDKWESLGWEQGFLGYPLTDETPTPDGVGRFNHFQGGSIYYHPDTGTYEVQGAIRDKWESLGWEQGLLGYPISDENVPPDGIGRFNHFQHGSIYWHPNIGAYEVHGMIRDRWEALGWEQGFLGYPLTDETGTPDGIGCFNHFQGGSIYFHPDTGAHEVHGPTRDKWEALGWEQGCLGYPLTDETGTPDGVGHFNHFQHGSIYFHPKIGTPEFYGAIHQRWVETGWECGGLGHPTGDEEAVADGGGIRHFEHGWIRWRPRTVRPLTFFVQNMALMCPSLLYKGTERSKAVDALIQYLRQDQPDVVGLCECFADGERDKIKSELRDIYPQSLEGPDESEPLIIVPADLVPTNGGLLLLSRHPLVTKRQTIYRECLGEDCAVNKGALHARIRAAGHLTDYDIFLTHLQAGNPKIKDPDCGPGSSARDKIREQLSHLASFIQACTDTFECPALLMGDLNTNAFDAEQYRDLIQRLHYPEDVWVSSGDGGQGVTSDSPDNNFTGKRNPTEKGSRIDYFLTWGGRRFWPGYRQTQVVKLESSPGRDLSDHYGVKTQLDRVYELSQDIQRTIGGVTIKLAGFHCLRVTGGPVPLVSRLNDDEVRFKLSYNTASQQKASTDETKLIEHIASGKQSTFPESSAPQLHCSDPGDWLEISVKGWEVDPIELGFAEPETRNALGDVKIRLSHEELLRAIGHSEIRGMPLLTGDGSEYVAIVSVAAEAQT